MSSGNPSLAKTIRERQKVRHSVEIRTMPNFKGETILMLGANPSRTHITNKKEVMEGFIREELAALSHKQWSRWMKYLFSKCEIKMDGSVNIPAWAVERWQRQMNTPYTELSEEEKESDRKEADKVFNTIALE